LLAAIFLILYSITLSLSPAGRERSWNVSYRWEHWVGFVLWIGLVYLAHRQSRRWLAERDPYLLPIGAFLSGWGLMTIWRLSPAFGWRQTFWLVISLVLVILGFRLPGNLNFLRRYKYLWLSGGLILTALTLIFGTNPGGLDHPRLWLGCCGFYLQPSEPLKQLLIIYLAGYFAGFPLTTDSGRLAGYRKLSFFAQLAPTVFMSGLAIILLLVQRDLGTATVFLFIYAVIVFLATGNRWLPVISGLAILIAGAAGYGLFDVVRIRIDAWLNPWMDASGRSFQIVQSLLAVANGGLLGRGPGLGNPGLVPVQHSDFIFSAIVEESGLWGGLGFLLCLALLGTRGIIIALRATDPFRRYLAAGLITHLISQGILIIGGNIRVLPLTGVTLPFVSYGGSSLLTSFISLLLLLLISNREEKQPAILLNEKPYLQLTVIFLAGILVCGLVLGWWGYWRGPDLLLRTDNARRSIADKYVKRGTIFDREDRVIVQTIGVPGEYIRQIDYPSLSTVIGYQSAVYGQSGVEEGMDDYLRGLKGYPSLKLWWNHLLYGQPPPGRDIRTSIDLNVQQVADDLLDGHSGALVVLNPSTGEVIAMSSHPTFDANQIDKDWEMIIKDSNSPLLNRAIMGFYNIGDLGKGSFLESTATLSVELFTPPGLPFIAKSEPDTASLQFSPMSIAQVAGLISNHGQSHPPVFVTAVNSYQSGWLILPDYAEIEQTLPESVADRLSFDLAVDDKPIWKTLVRVPNGSDQSYTWFVGGTLPTWNGTPLVVSLLLEEANQALADQIGQTVLLAAMGYQTN
jgi:cell division protein FtsW (lipid II flippase)